MLLAAMGIAAVASVPYLFDISTLDASTAASVALLAVIGATAFTSVRRAGGPVNRALAFTLIVVAVASVVVTVKYQLTH